MKTCDWCGKDHVSNIKDGNGEFCSHDCQQECRAAQLGQDMFMFSLNRDIIILEVKESKELEAKNAENKG